MNHTAAQVVEKARTVVIAGGTLSPLDQLADTLFPTVTPVGPAFPFLFPLSLPRPRVLHAPMRRARSPTRGCRRNRPRNRADSARSAAGTSSPRSTSSRLLSVSVRGRDKVVSPTPMRMHSALLLW